MDFERGHHAPTVMKNFVTFPSFSSLRASCNFAGTNLSVTHSASIAETAGLEIGNTHKIEQSFGLKIFRKVFVWLFAVYVDN